MNDAGRIGLAAGEQERSSTRVAEREQDLGLGTRRRIRIGRRPAPTTPTPASSHAGQERSGAEVPEAEVRKGAHGGSSRSGSRSNGPSLTCSLPAPTDSSPGFHAGWVFWAATVLLRRFPRCLTNEKRPDERLDRIQNQWWTKATFAAKQRILKAGVDAYKQRTETGYIACIKTLATEIEGILRAQYATDTGTPADLKIPALIQHIIDKEMQRAGSDASLLLPTPFLAYLRDVIFRGFDVTTGDVALSRNSAGHGVAKQEDYTRARALQLILTIDQVWFFS